MSSFNYVLLFNSLVNSQLTTRPQDPFGVVELCIWWVWREGDLCRWPAAASLPPRSLDNWHCLTHMAAVSMKIGEFAENAWTIPIMWQLRWQLGRRKSFDSLSRSGNEELRNCVSGSCTEPCCFKNRNFWAQRSWHSCTGGAMDVKNSAPGFLSSTTSDRPNTNVQSVEKLKGLQQV